MSSTSVRTWRTWRPPSPNPVLVKELRSRFRGPRAFGALTAFLIVLAVVAFLVYRAQMAQQSYRWGHSHASQIGESLFTTTALFELFLLAFIAPSLTMNAISGEVDRQTYELLLATPLSGWSILRGKLGSALAYVLLLILSTLPVMSLAFLFGGVSGVELARSQVTALVFGAELLTIGLFNSSVFKRTSRSAIATYATVAALTLLPPFLAIFWTALGSGLSNGSRDALLWALLQISTFLAGAISLTQWGFGVPEPLAFWALAMFLHSLIAVTFFVLAGARIRRVGPAWVAVVVALAFLFVAWLVVSLASGAMY